MASSLCPYAVARISREWPGTDKGKAGDAGPAAAVVGQVPPLCSASTYFVAKYLAIITGFCRNRYAYVLEEVRTCLSNLRRLFGQLEVFSCLRMYVFYSIHYQNSVGVAFHVLESF